MTSPMLHLAAIAATLPAAAMSNYQFDIEDYLMPETDAIMELSPYDDDMCDAVPAYGEALNHLHSPFFTDERHFPNA